jgi:hypothetical protein
MLASHLLQLAESGKALADEEDQVESLHAALGTKAAELGALQQQLARAEATAAAAMAAATTALSSALGAAGAGALAGVTSLGSAADALSGAALEGMNGHGIMLSGLNGHGNGNGHSSNGNGSGPLHGFNGAIGNSIGHVSLSQNGGGQPLNATSTSVAAATFQVSSRVPARHKRMP